MKHLFLSLTLCIVAIAAITGCSTKFNVAAPYKNTTVVYGLLDEGDTAHYIRIQKTFLSQTLSAYDMAKASDSSFYPQLNVVLKAFDMTNNQVGAPIQLVKVDLNQEGYPKDTGAFFNTPNYAYKVPVSYALNPAYSYRLVITNPTTGDVDSATTTVIAEDPTDFYCPPLDIPGDVDDIDFTHYNEAFQINGHVPSSAAYMEGVIRVQWFDVNSQTNTSVKHYADWNFGNVVPTSNGVSNGYALAANTRDFYAFLGTAMGPAPQYVTRLIDSAYLSVYAANADFYKYMQVTQTLGTGLTGMDIEPNYTNIVGTNTVIGLYAGRAVRAGYIRYTPLTIDSLLAYPALQNLNITGTSYH